MGYTAEEGYKTITAKREKKSLQKGGFKVKQRRSKTKITSKKLEHDKIIEENARKIMESLDKQDIPKVLSAILSEDSYLPVYSQKLPKINAEFGGKVDDILHFKGLRDKLKANGIEYLYRFQEEARRIVKTGEDLIITAPTGLGKTEAFLLPIIESLLMLEPDPSLRHRPSVLLLYPTKALAADQRRKIEYYCKGLGVGSAVYDGDTPFEERNRIARNPPDILISNADMVHYHLMGNLNFQAMMSTIKFLVIDEIHLCVGPFGSNVLWIIRRLKRFSRGLQCIGASATISNAKSFAEIIFDGPVNHISAGTARKSPMYLNMIYPKEVSNISAMSSIARKFVRYGNKTLVFANSHNSSEVINLILQEFGVKSEIHRAGLEIRHRQRVEQQFKSGRLSSLVSTPTLELGIDIGDLDSVVSMLTSLTSFIQRIGRAGRQGQESFATLVLRGDDPISAYFARRPEDYLTELEPVFVEPNNDLVAFHQLLAMFSDKPFDPDDMARYRNTLEQLFDMSNIRKFKGKYVYIYPDRVKSLLKNYSIRGIGNSVQIIYNKKVIGNRSLPMALSELHKGAIYLHGGSTYMVQSYQPRTNTSSVSKIRGASYKTQAMRSIHPEVLSISEEKVVLGLPVIYCSLKLTETVYGYMKRDIYTNKITGQHSIDPINYTFQTMGFVTGFPEAVEYTDDMDPDQRRQFLYGTYHAIEHVLIESGNSFTGGGANQIGGISIGDTGIVVVYDGNEGGSGLSKLLYNSMEKAINRTLSILENCPCNREDGCPRCTYSFQCGNNNEPLNRIGAIETLKLVGEITDETILDLDFRGIESFV